MDETGQGRGPGWYAMPGSVSADWQPDLPDPFSQFLLLWPYCHPALGGNDERRRQGQNSGRGLLSWLPSFPALSAEVMK